MDSVSPVHFACRIAARTTPDPGMATSSNLVPKGSPWTPGSAGASTPLGRSRCVTRGGRSLRRPLAGDPNVSLTGRVDSRSGLGRDATSGDVDRESTTAGRQADVASIEEVRAGIALATDKANESLGALQQAH